MVADKKPVKITARNAVIRRAGSSRCSNTEQMLNLAAQENLLKNFSSIRFIRPRPKTHPVFLRPENTRWIIPDSNSPEDQKADHSDDEKNQLREKSTPQFKNLLSRKIRFISKRPYSIPFTNARYSEQLPKVESLIPEISLITLSDDSSLIQGAF